MAAVGAFLGPLTTLFAAALTLIMGGAMAVAILLRHRGLGQFARRYFTTLNYLVVTGTLNHDGPREGEAATRRFPYALAIGLGTLWAILWLHQ
jgi:prepilin peptidase CpaA